jgi:hypothetical protein
VRIPARINGLPVTVIGMGAFERSQLSVAAIPDSVTVIGDYAFDNNPTGVALPANVEMDWDSFPGDLVHVYTKAGRRAGEYKMENEKMENRNMKKLLYAAGGERAGRRTKSIVLLEYRGIIVWQ